MYDTDPEACINNDEDDCITIQITQHTNSMQSAVID